MLATLQNAIFSVPENPVLRAARGLGATGWAMGQSVSMPGPVAPSPFAFNSAPVSQDPYQMSQNGSLIWAGGASDGSIYTASYCDQFITGAAQPSDQDRFQCSIRGFVGNSPHVQTIPPALVPDPPTSLTVPRAVAAVNTPRPPAPSARPRCSAVGLAAMDDNGGGTNWMLLIAAFGIGYLVMKG